MYKGQQKQYMVTAGRVLYALSAILTVIAGVYVEMTFSHLVNTPWNFMFAAFVTACAGVQMMRVFAASERSWNDDYASEFEPE